MKSLALIFLFLSALSICRAQSVNLLKNPGAENGEENWKAHPSSAIERESGNSVFVVHGGYFIQHVNLPKNSVDKFIVFIGSAASDRSFTTGNWEGRPAISTQFMRHWNERGSTITGSINGEKMISRAEKANEWSYVWGIYQVPVGTNVVSYGISQGLNPNVPSDGSTVKFDDSGLYLFDTEQAAKDFVASKIGMPVEVKVRKNTRTAPCKLTVKQAPKIFGLYLRMPLAEMLKLFPGINEENAPVQTTLKKSDFKTLKNGFLYFDPRIFSENPELANIRRIGLIFAGELVSSIDVETEPGGAGWNKVDDFIKSFGRKTPLPPLDTWETVWGIKSKYSVCEDFEISFFASPENAGTGDQIRLNELRY